MTDTVGYCCNGERRLQVHRAIRPWVRASKRAEQVHLRAYLLKHTPFVGVRTYFIEESFSADLFASQNVKAKGAKAS